MWWGVLCGQQPDNIGKQLYAVHCLTCHGAEGDSIAGVDLRRGKFKRVSSDDELSRVIVTGVPGTAMPPSNLPETSRTAIVQYIRREMPLAGRGSGDAQRGRVLLENRGCLDCHRAAGKGSHKGPDLSEVGSLRDAAALERSILAPGESILPQHRYIRAVTQDGIAITGLRLNEDTHSIQLIDANERLISLDKSRLREYTLLQAPSMPSYQGRLSAGEVADLVTYLLTLKGSQ